MALEWTIQFEIVVVVCFVATNNETEQKYAMEKKKMVKTQEHAAVLSANTMHCILIHLLVSLVLLHHNSHWAYEMSKCNDLSYVHDM